MSCGNAERLARSLTVALSLAATVAFSGNFATSFLMPAAHAQAPAKQGIGKSNFSGSGSGTLVAMTPGGKQLGSCPLKHTDVRATVSGYVGRVSVKQTFQNTFKDKIEAVYTFPLPENAAVDEMIMKVGKRVIRGEIKKKEEARQIYEQARAAGNVASLLDQERPNIFTQSVANIEPGEQVEIEIKYVDLLPYENGKFTFSFPTVVGPRFNPGNAVGHQGTGRAMDTDVVADASKITPPVAASGERAGHDLSISLDVDAGMPIKSMASALHEIKLTHEGTAPKAHLQLADKTTIPNKDFVVSWEVAADKVQSGYLAHNDGKSGFFTLMLMPPKRVTVENVAPKEMVFLVDCSGSQSGAPLQKAQETLDYIVDHMNPNDTFQIISFSDHLLQFADRPQKASPAMREKARKFVKGLEANGGTWMAPAVEKACSMPSSDNRLRIVTFMTDGYVGNDMEILGMIKKYRGKSRWFSFGTGNSVNRFLIDGIAKEGGGEADYVLLNSSKDEVGKKFYDRIKSPVLTDVKVEFNGLPVKEVFPHELSDVWAEKPLYIKGRYLNACAGTITLSGFAAGQPYKQELQVKFPGKTEENEVLKPIWARAKVDRLMSEDWTGAQYGTFNKELKDEIVKTALDYHIMTQYTSFVAVEEKYVTKGGEARKVTVPVEQPEGVSRAETLGEEKGTGSVTSFASGGSASGGFMPPTNMGKFVARASKATSVNGMLMNRRQRYAAPQAAVCMSPAPIACGSGGGSAPPPPLPSAPTPKPNLAGTGSTDKAPVHQVETLRGSQSGTASVLSQKKDASKNEAEDAPAVPATEAVHAFNKPQRAKEEKQAQSSKLDAAIQALVKALTSNPNATVPGLTIKDGKLLVKITLAEVSDSLLKQLKALGLEVTSTQGKTIVGRLPVVRIASVAGFAGVLHIEPKR